MYLGEKRRVPGGLWAAGRGEEGSIERIHGTADYGRRACSLLTGPMDVWCWEREKSGSPGPLLLVGGLGACRAMWRGALGVVCAAGSPEGTKLQGTVMKSTFAGNLPSTLLNLPSFSINNHQDQATSLARGGTELKKPVAVMLLESVWLHLSCFSTIWVNKLRH